ncbi:MAG: DUF4433 domain-containing protein [Pseudomonadota bacterium]
MNVPDKPKNHHIIHLDRLISIVHKATLWCDKVVVNQGFDGTSVGMSKIKQRRLTELKLSSHPGLFVGDCVPFYFCPRSIMLYLIYKANHEDLGYKDGQDNIVHLEADLYETINWAQQHNKKWAFTLSNAGSRIFEDRCDITQLNEIDWGAVNSSDWVNCQEGKQAEFLLEYHFPWGLINRIGVKNKSIFDQISSILSTHSSHKPTIEIKPDWYY